IGNMYTYFMHSFLQMENGHIKCRKSIVVLPRQFAIEENFRRVADAAEADENRTTLRAIPAFACDCFASVGFACIEHLPYTGNRNILCHTLSPCLSLNDFSCFWEIPLPVIAECIRRAGTVCMKQA